MLIGARVFLGVRVTALQALGAGTTMVGVVTIAAQGNPARLAALAFNHGDVMMLPPSFSTPATPSACAIARGFRASALAGMAVAAFVTSVPLMIWEIASGGFIWPTAADSRRSPM